jgi:hypothetical protein
MPKLFSLLLLSPAVCLQGCVIGTVVDVAAETIEAGVEVTGAVVGTAVDVVVPDDNDEEAKEDDDQE